MSPPSTFSPRVGYPLAGLFVLLALAAILSGLIAPVVGRVNAGTLDPAALAGSMIGSGFWLGLITALITFFAVRPRRWCLWAGAVGALIGATVGLMVWIPASALGSVAFTTTVGCAAMLAAAAIGRRR